MMFFITKQATQHQEVPWAKLVTVYDLVSTQTYGASTANKKAA